MIVVILFCFSFLFLWTSLEAASQELGGFCNLESVGCFCKIVNTNELSKEKILIKILII